LQLSAEAEAEAAAEAEASFSQLRRGGGKLLQKESHWTCCATEE